MNNYKYIYNIIYPEPELWVTKFHLFLRIPSMFEGFDDMCDYSGCSRVAFCLHLDSVQLLWLLVLHFRFAPLSPSALHSGLSPRQSGCLAPR